MSANPNDESFPGRSPLHRVAVVTLGNGEAPATLLRSLEALELTISLKPPLEEMFLASLVVLVGRDSLVADALAGLRGSHGALLPVLAMVEGAPSQWLDPSWTCLADDVLPATASLSVLATSLESLSIIALAVGALPGEEMARNEPERRRLRALRWIATRSQGTLSPAPAPGAPSLHRYAGLEAICGNHLAGDLAGLLNGGHLVAEVVDRVYRCPCGDARLHFRDGCEFCQSTGLEVAHVLLHGCGHSAPSAEFWRNEELVCPSCGVELKTAGADYQGPFDRIRCHSCGSLAKEGLTLATCTACGLTSRADRLPTTPLLRYSLTSDGRATLLAAPGPVPADDAQRRSALRAAWKRLSGPALSGRARPVASLVRYTGATGDLDAVLHATLRGSDVAVRVGQSGFVALLADTNHEGAQRFLARIQSLSGESPLAAATQVLVLPEQAAEIEAALAPFAEG